MNQYHPPVIFNIKIDGDEFQSACGRLFNVYQSIHYIYHISLSILQRHIYSDEQIDSIIDDIIECTEVDEIDYPFSTLPELEDRIRYDLSFVITELLDFYQTYFPQFMNFLRFLEMRHCYLDVTDWSLDRNDIMVGLITPRHT